MNKTKTPLIVALAGKMCTGKTTVANILANKLNKHKKFTSIVAFGDELKAEVADLYSVPTRTLYDAKLKNTARLNLSDCTCLFMKGLVEKQSKRFLIKLFWIATFYTLFVIGTHLWSPSEVFTTFVHNTAAIVACFILLAIGLVLFYPNIYGCYVTPRELLQYHGTEVRRKQKGQYYWANKLLKRIKEESEETGNTKVYIIDDLRFKSELKKLKEADALVVKIHPHEKYNKSKTTTLINKLMGRATPNCKHISEIDLDDVDFELNYYPKYGRDYLEEVAEDLFRLIYNKLI